MSIADSVRSLAARVAQCESDGGSKAEAEALRSQVADLEREVSSLEAANTFLRGENAQLRAQLRELRDRTGVMIAHATSWRNDH